MTTSRQLFEEWWPTAKDKLGCPDDEREAYFVWQARQPEIDELMELLGLAADYVFDVAKPDGTPDMSTHYLADLIRNVLAKHAPESKGE